MTGAAASNAGSRPTCTKPYEDGTAVTLSCTRCSWSVPAFTDEGYPVLECRLSPPQMVVVDGELRSQFIQVIEDDWCSYHEFEQPEGEDE